MSTTAPGDSSARIAPFHIRQLARLVQHVRTPMYRDGYALILNQALSAGLGIAYWAIAARLLSSEVLGQNVAILTTVFLLAAISDLSLTSAAIRFVPRAGARVTRLVLLTYGTTLAACALSGGVFLLANQLPGAESVLGGSSIGAGWLVIATMAWCIFRIQDGVLVGLRRATWVVVENAAFGVLKIVVLLFLCAGSFGGLASSETIRDSSVVSSWFLPTFPIILVMNALIFLRLLPRCHAGAQPETPITARLVATSVAGDYAGSLIAESCVRLLPLLVIGLSGASAGAHFYQVWVIITPLYAIASSLTASFTVEVASDLGRMAESSRRILWHMTRLIVPAAFLVFVFAEVGLGVFGEEYARDGASALRWLAFAALPLILNTWYLAYARVRSDTREIVLTQGMLCVLTLGLSYWWLPVVGLDGVGIAYLVAQTTVACLVVVRTLPLLIGSRPAKAASPRPDCTGASVVLARSATSRASHLFISPHLDDVALSCGGYVRRLADAGERVVIATVITADPPPGAPVSWLGRRSHAAWDLGDSPFAVRRHEDKAAAEVLGASCRHLGLLDMIDRRDSNGEPLYTRCYLGVEVHPHDRIDFEPLARERLRAALASVGPDVHLYCPLGVGKHLDHIVVRRAVEMFVAAAAEGNAGSVDITYYEDYPYADRPNAVKTALAGGSGRPGGAEGWRQAIVALTADETAARIAAVACYASQLSGLFPSLTERFLEVARTRLPFLPWPRIWRPDSRAASRRAAVALRRYVARTGGERFWWRDAGAERRSAAETNSGSSELRDVATTRRPIR